MIAWLRPRAAVVLRRAKFAVLGTARTHLRFRAVSRLVTEFVMPATWVSTAITAVGKLRRAHRRTRSIKVAARAGAAIITRLELWRMVLPSEARLVHAALALRWPVAILPAFRAKFPTVMLMLRELARLGTLIARTLRRPITVRTRPVFTAAFRLILRSIATLTVTCAFRTAFAITLAFRPPAFGIRAVALLAALAIAGTLRATLAITRTCALTRRTVGPAAFRLAWRAIAVFAIACTFRTAFTITLAFRATTFGIRAVALLAALAIAGTFRATVAITRTCALTRRTIGTAAFGLALRAITAFTVTCAGAIGTWATFTADILRRTFATIPVPCAFRAALTITLAFRPTAFGIRAITAFAGRERRALGILRSAGRLLGFAFFLREDRAGAEHSGCGEEELDRGSFHLGLVLMVTALRRASARCPRVELQTR